MAPDPARRLSAAQSVFRSRDATVLPAVEKALEAETNARVKKALNEARAAIIVLAEDTSADDKIAAIAVIRERSDQESLALMSGLPASLPPEVRAAATDAVAKIQSNLAIWRTVQNFWYGLSLGSVLLLAAIGLAITFGVMGVINMAHGEMVMLGAYTTYVVQEFIRTRFPELFDYSLAFALPLAFMFAGAVGILIERTVIRYLYGRPLETLLATWGISLVLDAGGARRVRADQQGGRQPELDVRRLRSRRHPDHLQPHVDHHLHRHRVRRAAGDAALHAARPGDARRHAEPPDGGGRRYPHRAHRRADLRPRLRHRRHRRRGAVADRQCQPEPRAGLHHRLFMVVVFGGVGNLWGTLVGALTLGIANKFLEPFAGAVLAKIAILVFIILFIQKRPRGMFALKGRAIEA